MAKWTQKAWIPWVGTLVIVLSWFIYRAVIHPGPKLIPLTRANLSEARAKWTAAAIRNYSMDITITGVQQGNDHVDVENGKVVRMTTDEEPTPQTAWEYWSIEGMFGFLEEELVQADTPTQAFQIDDKSKVYLSVFYNQKTGVPEKYLRQVFGRKLTIEWQITNFNPRP